MAPPFCWHNSSQTGSPGAAQTAFLAVLFDKPQSLLPPRTDFSQPRTCRTGGCAGPRGLALLSNTLLGECWVSAFWPPELSRMLRSYLALLRRLFPTVPFSPGAGPVPIPSGHSCSKGQSEPLGARLAAQGWPQGWDDAAARFGCSAPTASSSHVRRGLRWVPACPCIPTGPWLLFHPGRDLLASNTRRRGLQSFRWGNARGDTPPPANAGEEHAGFWAQS